MTVRHVLRTEPAQADRRYQITCAFCGLGMRSVDRTAAPNANLQLLSVDADRLHEEQEAQASGLLDLNNLRKWKLPSL